jgi:hypothetical protein
MQCGAARNGELISVSLCNDEEQIHIEGNPKHIVAALKEALGAIEAVLAHPPAEEMESHGVLVEGKALRKWEADALIAARVRDSKEATDVL